MTEEVENKVIDGLRLVSHRGKIKEDNLLISW